MSLVQEFDTSISIESLKTSQKQRPAETKHEHVPFFKSAFREPVFWP